MSDCNCTSANVASLVTEETRMVHLNQEQQNLLPPKKLSFVDTYLTVWILGAMVMGVLIGYFSPSSSRTINSWKSGSVNWPIAIGLIVMMFPPLARVNYDQVGSLLKTNIFDWSNISSAQSISQVLEEVTTLLSKTDSRCGEKCVCRLEESNGNSMEPSKFKFLLQFSLILNWIIGPFLMFFLACACLPDGHTPYIRGLIMVGLARCIAMVIVWNDLASGSPEYAAILVCLNSLFQILCYSPYAYFFISVFLPLFKFSDSSNENINISFAVVVESVAIYLGIPFVLGLSCWILFNRVLHDEWKEWYKAVFVPRTAPLTLIALLFTIIVMFILKGRLIVSIPLQVVRVAIPLCIYFTVMFVGVYYCCYRFGFSLEETITLAFTSASNNFELAIAVSIGVFGINSPEAFVGVIGPLVEVPVMLGFVHLVKVLHSWWPTMSDQSDEKLINSPPLLSDPRNILFLCTGNSCRSHMAQGWAWYYHRDTMNLKSYSAGTSPEPGHPGGINPYAIKAMMSYGIDISQHQSKNILDLKEVDLELVITVCDDAAQSCPMFKPHKNSKNVPRVIHHSFDDPPRLVGLDTNVTEEEQKLIMETYNRVCEEIRVWVSGWLQPETTDCISDLHREYLEYVELINETYKTAGFLSVSGSGFV
eukprot:gene8800-11882_t